MNRVFLSIGLVCVVTTSPALALDLTKVAEVTITPAERERSAIDSLFSCGRWEQVQERASAVLDSNAGDGFAIRAMVLCAGYAGRLTEFCRMLDAGAPSPWSGIDRLGSAQREYALGLSDYYRGRLRSADRHLSTAIDAAPGWSWPLIYRVRCRRAALAPATMWEADLQTALQDPDVAGAVLCHLSRVPTPGSLDRERREACSLLDAAAWPRWIGRVRTGRLAWEATVDSAVDAAAARSAWQDLRATDGMASLIQIPTIGARITDLMLPEDAEAFCLSESQTPIETQLWSLVWAHCLTTQERDKEAATLLGSLPPFYANTKTKRFYRRLYHDSADTLMPLACEALEGLMDSWLLLRLQDLQRAAPGAIWDSLTAAIEVENPAAVIKARLTQLLDKDLQAGLALIDSLKEVRVDLGGLGYLTAKASEHIGDTAHVEAVLSGQQPAIEAGWRCGLADAALTRGDRPRARRHILRAQRLDPENASLLSQCLSPAAKLQDRSFLIALTDSLIAHCGTCAYVLRHAVHGLATCGETDRAHDVLRRAATDPRISAATACALAHSAEYLGEHDLADSLLKTAEAEEPDSRMVRYYRARYLTRQRRLNEARALAQTLVNEFPGSEDYRTLLREAGGQVSVAMAPTASGDPFASLQHDLTSTDWILTRAAEAKTIQDVDAVFLKKRLSVVADRQDRASLRTRETILIVTEQGLSRYQPYRIHFSASDPAPEVRVARVIREDGSIVDVPRTDILVTAPEDESSDVGESRCLVIPFAALQPGCILDLTYDGVEEEYGPAGWSMRLFLAEADTMQQCTVEFLCTDNLPITIHATAGIDSDRESRIDDRTLHTWEIEGVAPIVWEQMSGNIWNSHTWIGFSTYPSWEEGLRRFQREYWNHIRAEELQEQTAGIIADAHSPREKLENIYLYIHDSVRYLAIELDRGRIIPTPPTEVLSRGYGDCKDMVALFTTMLEAAGIQAEPMLVSTPDGRAPVRELPEPFIFNHMILLVPEIDGGIFCDLTTGSVCLEPGPTRLSGTEGISLSRDGSIRWRKLPESSADENGFDLEADLYPADDDSASIKVTMTCRGAIAEAYREFLAVTDSADAVPGISEKLGYGLWPTCKLNGWDLERNDCDAVVMRASFVDTAWAGPSQNSIQFLWTTEVADPLFYYPSAEGRTQDAVLPYPFRDTAVLRFHRTSPWRTEPKLASVRVSGDFYSGKIEAKERSDGDDSWVEVRQEFRLTKDQISADEYREFHDDWIRFLVAVYQPYSYYRALASKDLEQIEAYLQAHLDDTGFALQAAGRILGEDLGGEGETGLARREAARRWLSVAAKDPSADSSPAILLAILESKEGRYVRADSLLTAAAVTDPGNAYLLANLAWIKQQLGKMDERIDILQTLQRQFGNRDLLLALISALYQTSRDDEAADAEQRYFLLYGGADSSQVLLARYGGLSAAWRHESAERILEQLRGRLDEHTFAIMEQEQFLHRSQFEQAREVLERLWKENPLDSFLCNNLAWVYAVLGVELDRAEELANAAVVLSADHSASRNTLGAIYARQGHWKKAKETFQLALESDDRPSHMAANSFFLGLCEYQLGHRDKALVRWRNTQEISGSGMEALSWIRKALDLHDRNELVTGAIFVSAPE
ncbi:DUF3857 domain-containing protein [Candidatus Eisenbacteria bacterium]|uniref:DUF3857 domain-containing protein n=1 Tax=Eiseniibacteriota bacterium TaxID=2212470 RepID=A0ABV6YK42_UNCEI